MISFENFQIREGSPIYQQIVDFIERGVAAGIITDGDELPSRRILSAVIGVNPNTVQKACRLLEENGVIQSRSGAKSYASVSEELRAQLRAKLVRQDLEATVHNMRQLGISRQEALSLLEAAWDNNLQDTREE